MTEDLPQKGVKYIKINFSKFQLIPVNKLVKIYCEGGQFIRRWNICLKMALARSRDELRHMHCCTYLFTYLITYLFSFFITYLFTVFITYLFTFSISYLFTYLLMFYRLAMHLRVFGACAVYLLLLSNVVV